MNDEHGTVHPHAYFRIPKPFTRAALRCQAEGLRAVTHALFLAVCGRAPLAREIGRCAASRQMIRAWLDLWMVLKREGWILQAPNTAPNPNE